MQREELADAVHEIWAHWMKYQFSQCTIMCDGGLKIPVEKVRRWTNQMHTDYDDLTERERDSDRHIVDQFLARAIKEQ